MCIVNDGGHFEFPFKVVASNFCSIFGLYRNNHISKCSMMLWTRYIPIMVLNYNVGHLELQKDNYSPGGLR